MNLRGMFNVTLFVTMLCALVFPVCNVTASSGGAPAGNTGGPGEGTCNQCHSNGPDDGDFFIQGVPSNYELQQTYSITISLEDSGQSRWGFQLTAMDNSNTGVGTIIVTEPGVTSSTTAFGKEYLNHTASGTYNGTPDGPVTWSFDWTAPSSNVGPITFYAAGNAANGNLGTSGDNIYTTNETANAPAGETPTPNPTATPTGTGPTPTPGQCTTTGTTLDLPDGIITPGDIFYLDAIFCNAGSSTLIQHPLLIMMDAYGQLYFAPSWGQELDYYLQDFPVGETIINVLPEFAWPAGSGSGTVAFYAALTDPLISMLIGDFEFKEFSWAE